jgi:hypothetical protein
VDANGIIVLSQQVEIEDEEWVPEPGRPHVNNALAPVPGLVCAALFAFTLSWNEFIYALTFTSSSDEITASVGVTQELIRGDICAINPA